MLHRHPERHDGWLVMVGWPLQTGLVGAGARYSAAASSEGEPGVRASLIGAKATGS